MSERDMKGKFLPGHTKLGGSKKGWRWLANDLYPYLKEQGVDPKEILVDRLRHHQDKVTIGELLRILEFCYAKKKAIAPTKNDEEETPEDVGDFSYLLDAKKETDA